jgi:cephalosporin hydroxylase
MISIDEERGLVTVERDGREQTCGWDTPEGFAIMSELWLRAGWAVKHVYSFTWLGRPVIQLPEDLVRLQELVYRLRPDLIVETGVAHGGGLVFYASLCRLFGRGRVVGVDVEIRPHNRAAIESHPLSEYITLVEGDSADPATAARVGALTRPGETVLVLLDSDHSKEHVLAELRAYAPLVSRGSYAVAMDGHIMELVAGGPRARADWRRNNPRAAAEEFVRENPSFVLEEPPFLFNEGVTSRAVSYWSGCYVKRVI